MVRANQNLNDSRDLTTPLLWLFAIHGLALTTYTYVEVYISNHYKDMKGDTKYRK